MLAYLNGTFLPRSEAKIPIEDRGFIFGDGVYEVWRVINGRLFEPDRHLARLDFGLSELKIQKPDVLDPARLNEVAERLLSETGLTDGEATLYLEITRGVAPRAHQFPPSATSPTVYITANRLTRPDAVRATGAACVTVPDIRWMRCDIKTIQLLPNVMAKQAAAEKGAFEAIMVRNGIVTEGSHTNLMAVIDGTIRTHPTNNFILPGVTRAVVLDIATRAGIPVFEEAITESELGAVEELFLTGTTTDVMPVVRVNDRVVGGGVPGPISLRLIKELNAYMDAAMGAAHA